jgi:hypothetical protein
MRFCGHQGSGFCSVTSSRSSTMGRQLTGVGKSRKPVVVLTVIVVDEFGDAVPWSDHLVPVEGAPDAPCLAGWGREL